MLRSERVQPKDFQTYIKEVQLIQSFNHPHVLSFVGVCCEPPHVCIGAAAGRARARPLRLADLPRAAAAVTEFLECGSLYHLLHPRPPPGEVSSRPVCLGCAPARAGSLTARTRSAAAPRR